METNVIFCGDNREALPKYIPDESIDLIYIDPPFNTSRQYEVFWGEAQERRAFEDRFGDAMTYLEWMRPRLREMYRVLKPTGSFYYHCDWHASHYIKVELDRIFGFENFRSEIVWKRTTSHNDARRNFGAVSDSIFYYVKTRRAVFHPQMRPLDTDYVADKYRYLDERGRRYRVDNLRSPHPRPNLTYEYKGFKPHPNGWSVSLERMRQLDAEGRLEFPKSPEGRIQVRRYLDERTGIPVNNLWDDIPPVNSQALEREGYPTQKPLPLLDRIIKASSDERQVVLDAFCGCGTTLEAAAILKRQFIGIDLSPTACRLISARLERLGLQVGVDFTVRDMPKSEAELRRMPPFEFQNWAVVALGGIPNRVKVGDFGIDGRLYLADVVKEKRIGYDLFGDIDRWYPIQVKQVDRIGRPDIDSFETAMRRDKRVRGYVVGFGFSNGAIKEIQRANMEDGLDILPITVQELLKAERVTV